MSVENMNIVRRMTRTPVERFEEVYHPNFVNHPPLREPGVFGMKDLARRYGDAFDKLETSIEAQWAAGDKQDMVVTVFRMRGVHTGHLDTPFGRMPPSNKSVDMVMTTITRIADGRIVERWGFV